MLLVFLCHSLIMLIFISLARSFPFVVVVLSLWPELLLVDLQQFVFRFRGVGGGGGGGGERKKKSFNFLTLPKITVGGFVNQLIKKFWLNHQENALSMLRNFTFNRKTYKRRLQQKTMNEESR